MNASPTPTESSPSVAKTRSPAQLGATYFGLGLLFAAGLLISGMTLPTKVVAFLDVAGAWDPSLGFVMGGAIAVHLALYKWILRRPSPLMAVRFGIPTRTDIDLRLVAGAALFGVGWALGGLCPGPALVAIGGLGFNTLLFVGAMLAGMQGFHMAERWHAARS